MPGASGWLSSLSASAGGRARGYAEHGLDPFARQSAGAEQHRRLEAADDGRFDADRDRPAVDDQVDPPRKVALDMGGQRRRDVAGDICGRRHHRPAKGAQDRFRHRMGGNADRDRVEARGGELRHRTVIRLRHHQRQRPRPERLRKAQGARIEPADPPRGREIRRHGRSAD